MEIIKSVCYNKGIKTDTGITITLNMHEASVLFHNMLDITPERIDACALEFRDSLKAAIKE